MSTRSLAIFLAGIVVGFAVAMWCVAIAWAAEPVTRTAADVNADGQVNVLDLLNVALCFGEVSEEPCQTPSSTPSATASSTASSTATSTATNTATNSATITVTFTPTLAPTGTATPSATATAISTYTIDNLIADSTGPHEGCLSRDSERGVAGYDWDDTARAGGEPTGNKLTPWYQVTIDHCPDGVYQANPPIGSGRVQLKNFRSYALTTGSVPWRSMGAVLDPGQWGNYTIGFRGGCQPGGSWNARNEEEGISFGPGTDPVCIAHGWVWPRISRPEPTLCVLVLIDFRLLGSGSFLVNVGMDDYNNESIIKDVGIGAFNRAGPWRTTGMTSCTQSELETHTEF